MKFEVERFSPQEWLVMAKDAHQAVFDEHLSSDDQKIDFALIGTRDGKAVAYMTCREVDQDSVYMKHGGVFEPYRDGVSSFKVYQTLLGYLRSRYANISTLVDNRNSTYLRMALGTGLRVVGVRMFKSDILVELYLEGERNVTSHFRDGRSGPAEIRIDRSATGEKTASDASGNR